MGCYEVESSFFVRAFFCSLGDRVELDAFVVGVFEQGTNGEDVFDVRVRAVGGKFGFKDVNHSLGGVYGCDGTYGRG